MLSAIVVAAGKGRRLKLGVSKPLVRIGKFPVLYYSLDVLDRHPDVGAIVVVANKENRRQVALLVEKYSFRKVKEVVLGGKHRQDSVYRGLQASSGSDWVLIHDAARPFIDRGMVGAVVRAAKKSGAAITAVKPKATIKVSGRDNIVRETLKRDELWEVQTPQVFRRAALEEAYLKHGNGRVTDDASLAEKLGLKVKVVPGSYDNIKITTGEDLLLAALIVKRVK
ncbi:MAG: 2-C-methyl-D-erythritol 4-phosphate cytidylyltransferase [Candidatus Omnitrophica bacterium]|jgi:2-C-methyl-D-erythritol 4-phosphate cytidylyltransferase|nr:2-C-methyl-D-erythritol 4-phosphate cytidylyltransferase [Candidatus Omnitrophota bacterium]